MDKKKFKQNELGVSKDTSLHDTHRLIPKKDGGDYVKGNVIVTTPIVHMATHKTLREREADLEELKSLVDYRNQVMKTVVGIRNRMLAVKRRTDYMDQFLVDFLKESLTPYEDKLKEKDKKIKSHLDSMDLPIISILKNIDGVGPITIANLINYIDISKAQYASSLWAYVGYDKPSYERYTKNVASGGNKTLRTALFNTASSFLRGQTVYSEIYNNAKAKYKASEKMTKSRNTQGKLIECKWKETKDCHKHGAAMRKMMKHFLADLWYVWRTVEGFDVPPLYVESKLGHKGIIKPQERGWVF